MYSSSNQEEYRNSGAGQCCDEQDSAAGLAVFTACHSFVELRHQVDLTLPSEFDVDRAVGLRPTEHRNRFQNITLCRLEGLPTCSSVPDLRISSVAPSRIHKLRIVWHVIGRAELVSKPVQI